jgi:hypothetical protein
MRPRTAALESLHTAALGLWLGVLILAGAAAAILFPTMHSLDPTLREYPAYTGPHWSLAAGTVANRIFNIAGIIEVACAAVFLATLAALLVTRSLTRWAAILRTLITGVLAAAWVLRTIPSARIAAELVAYDHAAHAGDNALAEQHRAVIAAIHPFATNLMAATAILLILALAASLLSTARAPSPEPR